MTGNVYKTLEGVEYRLDELSKVDRRIYKAVQAELKSDPRPSWTDIANVWTALVVKEYTESPEIVELPIYKICQDIEIRRGIEQGMVQPPANYDPLWGELGMAARAKLLFLFYTLTRGDAEKAKRSAIPVERVDSYVYLLHRRGILFVPYVFRNRPEPYSDGLHSDLDGLIGAGCLTQELREARGKLVDSCYITAHGFSWVSQTVPVAEPLYQKLIKAIANKIEVYETMSDRELFDVVFLMAGR